MRLLGSSASLTASPIMMNDSTVMASASDGQNSTAGSTRSRFCAAEMSPPQLTTVLGRPMPRKLSVASETMYVPSDVVRRR